MLFFGIFAPDLRASLKAIATACLRLFTFFPLPDFSLPCLCSFITLWTLRLPLEPLLELEWECVDLVAISFISSLMRRAGVDTFR